jgi:pseudaminic acid synthase
MKDIKIGNMIVGPDQDPFIIAEMSGNHNQSLDRALQIVEAAAGAGAHALKLQTYTADTMTLDLASNEFFIQDSKSLWKGKSLYQLYEEAATPWEWHEPIFSKCRDLGIIGFSSPFDESSLEFLEGLDVPAYKIASPENIDIPLIKKVAATGKPLILSTGMATLEELREAIDAAHGSGCEDIILLKCTTAYPAKFEECNLATIPFLQETFKTSIGLSDHTMGTAAAVASIALGGRVVEKHFTLARTDGGVDSAFSLEPQELETLVRETKQIRKSIGKIHFGPTEAESDSHKYRRSLYIVKDMKKGDLFTKENLRNIRPGLGLPPKYINQLIGEKIVFSAKMGTPASFDMIE